MTFRIGYVVLSIDTGDLDIVEQFAKTGYITDATTNPLFVSQVHRKMASRLPYLCMF